MAKRTDLPGNQDYSSGVKKVLILGADGQSMASLVNPLPVDAVVTVDTMEITAEMKVDSGHDLYLIDGVGVTGALAVDFLSVSGLNLLHIQAIENKTRGWIYSTKGATVTSTTIALVAANQVAGYPAMVVGDEIEVIYRGTSRFDSDPLKKITSQLLSAAPLAYVTDFGAATKLQSVMIKFSGAIDQKITIKLKSGDGADYDTVLRDDDLTGVIDYFWQPDSKIIITSADELEVTCTNSGTPAVTAYLTVLGENK